MRASARTAAILTASAVSAAMGLAAGPAAAETAPSWKKPRVVTEHASFSHVGASSWNNIWAVGNAYGASKPLAARWNGSAWSKIALPSDVKRVDAVTASTVHNTWLLDVDGSTHLRKWDNGTWSTPSGGHGKGVTAIAATGSDVLWAGGTGFIRHYDGRAWKQRALPKSVTIDHIAANGSSDVWAVGHRDLPANDDFEVRQRPYALHWNGTSWTTTPVPGYPADGGDGDLENLSAVAFSGPNDVYATGVRQNTDEDIRAIVVHWNGKAWSKVAASDLDGLYGATPAAAGGLWTLNAGYLDRKTTMYRSTSGKWSKPTLPGAGKDTEPNALLRVPGTTRTIAVGTAGEDGVIWLDG